MREERGQIPGDVVVYEKFTLWGSIGGNVTVIEGGKLYVRGSIYGNMTVEAGGRVHILGSLTGDLIVKEDAKVIVSGTVGGTATNLGGRLQVEASAQVLGKIRTKDGRTVVEEKKPQTKEHE